ncbi:hypothetical protein [Rhizobium sp. AAP43]|uniref:hypothetical protein n=1 Tax=Rhizobium sp. AAP43 TaxID=1523420 RepID=UPI000AAFF2D7|nr:hypothetical protein [Rhizobium sp. AAP43]
MYRELEGMLWVAMIEAQRLGDGFVAHLVRMALVECRSREEGDDEPQGEGVLIDELQS